MAFPCCMSLSTGVRLATILSIVLAIGLGAVSGWLLKDTYEFRNEKTTKVLTAFGDIASTLNEAVGGSEIDLDKVLRIKLACAGTAFGGAVLQLLTSLLLLCCSSAKGGRATASVYVFVNTIVLFALGAAIACFFTAPGIDYEGDEQIQYFLAACAIDFVFLLYLLGVAGAFIRS